MSAVITGRGTFLPPDELCNADVAALADPARLEAFVESNSWCRTRRGELSAPGLPEGSGALLARKIFAEFIEQRVGIRVRRVIDRAAILARRPSQGEVLASHLGAQAAQQALTSAGLRPEEIDLVVCGSSTPNSLCPATAVEIQAAIGATNAFAFDVMAACTSFAYALTSARALVVAGTVRRALVVAAEYFTLLADWADPATSYFPGDGAAAVVVEQAALSAGRPGLTLVDSECRSRLSEHIRTGLGGTRSLLAQLAGSQPGAAPAPALPGSDGYLFFHQNGPQVYREVIPEVLRTVRTLLARHGLRADQVQRWWVHQASLPMIDGIFERLLGGRPASTVLPLTLGHMGNTSSCGAAFTLAEDRGLAPGEHGVLLAFGGGYTVGSVLLRG